ncbi:MAG TPA: hypothetical protein VF614_00355, partial [Chthoniobacteraceae bacterium]
MSSQLDPKILAKLRAFAARRRKLIIIRGICAAVAMLLATMMLVALIDWIFILPDEVRWGLSAAAYLAVIVVEWRTCLRVLAHAPGPRRLARLLEHAEPRLREDLLSAVELGTSKESEIVDSPQFRQLVQSDVAARVENLEVDRLLPVHLLKRSLGIAAAIFIALIVAFAATGLQFGTLFMRALLPLGNFARVSRFQVEIVEPSPAERLVPQGDTVPLLVAISGGRTNKAFLETFTKTGGRELIPMIAQEGDRFSATIQVGREHLEYRVRAGDAITRKYRLEAASRPHVVQFEKTYRFPSYAGLEARSVTEENGDLTALEGTEVELRLQANQAVERGELRIEQGKTQTTVPLQREGDRLVGRLPMTASGTYRVFLVSAASGFENKFSPQYEIRAEADLLPQIELELPKQDLILPANDIVDIRGEATDDQALAKVAQLIRVNDGEWQEVPLTQSGGRKAQVERRWNLHEQGVRAGDLLAMKLVAFDRKGNKAESRALRLTITTAGFETKRLHALEGQRLSWEALKNLRAAAEALEKQAAEAREKFKQLPAEDPARRQVLISSATALEEFEEKRAEAWSQLVTTLRGAEPAHASANFVLLGRQLSRTDVTTAQFARDALNLAEKNPAAPYAADLIREYRDQSKRTAERARLLEESARALLAAEELNIVVENGRVLVREQERVRTLAENSGDDAAKWAQLAPRMQVVLAEGRSVESLMDAAAGHLTGGNADRLKRIAKEVQESRAKLVTALAAGAPGKALLEPTKSFTDRTKDLSRKLLEVRRDEAGRFIQVVTDLRRQIEPTWMNLEWLRSDLQQVQALGQLAPELRAQLVDRRWEGRTEAFKQHGSIEEQRPAFDAYFVSDVRMATLALQGLRIEGASALEPVKDKFSALDKGFRILQSGHDISEVLDGLTHLTSSERYEIKTPRARTVQPRNWDWIESRLKALPDEMGRLDAKEEATRKIIEEARNLVREALRVAGAEPAKREMRERFNPDRAPLMVNREVEQVAVPVRKALELLRPVMDNARKMLAELTPSLNEQMAQLAKDTEKLKQETAAQAE